MQTNTYLFYETSVMFEEDLYKNIIVSKFRDKTCLKKICLKVQCVVFSRKQLVIV